LGQHFLTSPSYARKIAEAVPEKAGKEKVLEIGPGKGALSIYLKQRFSDFHMVEVDPEAIEQLRIKLGDGNYTIHHADILEFDFSTVGFPLHVVGNLPYSIGAMIIKKTLLLGNKILSCTFMVQREVAERIVSAPHSKTNGFLSIFCSFFGTPRILFHVPPGAFFPRPNVESSVFQIIIDKEIDRKLEPSCWEPFFSFVSKGFSQRRKQLSKVLGHDQSAKEKIKNDLLRLGLDPLSRPEDLGVNEWLSLFRLRQEEIISS